MSIIPETTGSTLGTRVENLRAQVNGVDARAAALEAHTSGWVNVRSYGAKGDGTWNGSAYVGTDDGAAISAAVAAAVSAGHGRVDFPPGVYVHASPLTIAASTLHLFGDGATLFYSGPWSSDGVKITPAANSHGDRLTIRGLKFWGGDAALRIEGSPWDSTSGYIFSNVLIEGATIRSSQRAALWLTHVRDFRISENSVLSGADNGIYAEFSDRGVIDGNTVTDCAGSGAITVGYSSDTIAARSIVISDNVIENTESAGSANHLSGIDVVFASEVDVVHNLIVTRSASYPYKTGISVEEYALSNIQIRDNTIIGASERGIRVGTDANSVVSNVSIRGNKIRRNGVGGLDGILVQRATEVLIKGNELDGYGQNGINADSTASGVHVVDNVFRDVGVQENDVGSSGSVKSSAPRTEVIDNLFIVSGLGGIVTSSATNPRAWVDTTTTPRRLTLDYNNGGNTAATIDLDGKTWADLKTAIEAVTDPSAGAWTFTLNPGTGSQPARPIRRTGTRNGHDVASAAIPAAGLYLGVPEPYSFATITGAAGRVYGNRYTLPAGFNPPNWFAAASSNQKFVLVAGTESDTTPYGNRTMYGTAAPTTGQWWVGDRVLNQTPAVGQPKSWSCTVSGTPGTWVSEGNL